jgi:hypothetical protein
MTETERRQREMAESLRTYGTVSFTREIMSELIGWGTAVLDADGYYVLDPRVKPTNLSFAIWLTLVPKVYRKQVVDITIEIGNRYMGQKATKELLEAIISETLSKIRDQVEPVSPFNMRNP